MDPLLSIGIGIGVLAGVWTQVSALLALPTWIAFISWAAFYAAGGKTQGLLKVLPTTLSGVLWGFLMVQLGGLIGGTVGLAIAIAVLAVLMVVQAKWSVLAFVPGAFAGAASYFGSGLQWRETVICLVVGALAGWLSEAAATWLQGLGRRRAEAEPAA
ncbi:DUF1097 domain-containing protein [Actinotalea sp. M2MS4P-6]|uniref:DUF1097 domain-containing protein n=1 Tax=Actinotalea sp. M2MS4P-6 TaxID=2983762 RepID=UPI0021E46025|nr:DUF1097 domain-containing protein [Actinotalea sp. M2MS4P-6]MCV2395649.1 DUF1097 domain-containing protein [Actinotalea sp. M2MS4P-6]